MPLKLLLNACELSAAAWFKSFAYCAASVFDAFLLISFNALSVIEELTIPRLAKPETALPTVACKSLFNACRLASA